MKKLITAPLILLLFAIPSLTHAQYIEDDMEDEGGIMIGPRIGYYEFNDAEEGAFFVGLQLRGHLNDYFGLEFAATYRTTSEFQLSGGGEVQTGLVPITLSGLVYIPVSEHFMPYGIAGVGGYYRYSDTDGVAEEFVDDFQDEFIFGYHLGFGLEVPLSEAIAISADYRYTFLNPEENEPDLSGNAFTVGLMFRL